MLVVIRWYIDSTEGGGGGGGGDGGGGVGNSGRNDGGVIDR